MNPRLTAILAALSLSLSVPVWAQDTPEEPADPPAEAQPEAQPEEPEGEQPSEDPNAEPEAEPEPEQPEPEAEPEAEPPAEPPEENERSQLEDEMFGGGDEEADREAEMFGGEDAETETETESKGDTRDEQALGGLTSNQEIFENLSEADDFLQIGGLLFLRFDYFVLDKGDIEDYSLQAPNFLDLYLDSRPSDRVRAYINARLSYNPAIEEGATGRAGQTLEKQSFALDQVWLKFDLEQTVYFTIGKQRIKWGSGRFWNPTDFLNNERLDPLSVAVFDERLGVSLLKMHIPVESLGWNIYVIGTFDDANDASEVGGAVRGEFVIGTSELATSVAVRKNNPLRMGIDWTAGIGPIDFKTEIAGIYNLETPFFRGYYDDSPLRLDEFDLDGVAPGDIPAEVEAQLPGVLAARQPETYFRDEELLPQIMVGIDYSFNYNDLDDAIYLGAEYFYNHQGYDNADLYPVLFANGQFTPFYTGRHYAAVYGLVPGPGTWDDTTFVLSTLGNISDRSFVTRLDYSVRFLTYLTFNAYAQAHYGNSGEFNYEYSTDPLIPADVVNLIPPEDLESLPSELTEGVSIPGPLVDIGVGLRTVF